MLLRLIFKSFVEKIDKSRHGICNVQLKFRINMKLLSGHEIFDDHIRYLMNLLFFKSQIKTSTKSKVLNYNLKDCVQCIPYFTNVKCTYRSGAYHYSIFTSI